MRFARDRPECRYPPVTASDFSSIASQVLWSATPPRDFPDNGTWGFLGARADADVGAFGRNTFTYDSDGAVKLTLDVKDRPVSATAPRGPFTLSFARYTIATVGNAESLPGLLLTRRRASGRANAPARRPRPWSPMIGWDQNLPMRSLRFKT